MTKEAILVVAEDQAIRELRRHNRFMHGWGVVCGLSVTAAPTSGTPWRVQIGSGYALGPYGDEIFVAEAVYFDLAACLLGGVTNPCEPDTLLPGAAGTSTTAYLAIKYSECLARPVQVAYSGCGCSDDPCQYSRIRDSFQIQCLPQLPELPPSTGVTLCDIRNGALAPCPPSPTNPWVALAKIMLPSLSSTNISDSMIVTKGRPTILSTAVLQDQIIRCCCQEQTPPPSPVDRDLKSADAAVKVGLAVSRHVGDQYYLPRNLTAVAELKVAENEPKQADLLFEEAENVIDGMLQNQHTDYGKAALAGSMSETYCQMKLSLLLLQQSQSRPSSMLKCSGSSPRSLASHALIHLWPSPTCKAVQSGTIIPLGHGQLQSGWSIS